jgi:predicted nucleic acid-binding protein
MLLLDSEAISTMARGTSQRIDRVRALVGQARMRDQHVGTVSAVLAEVVRGRSADAQVFSALRRERVQVWPVDTRVAVRAGQLLGAVRRGSELAVDAFLVAVADLAGGAVIATVDVDDLRRLAARAHNVQVVSILPAK